MFGHFRLVKKTKTPVKGFLFLMFTPFLDAYAFLTQGQASRVNQTSLLRDFNVL